MTERTSGEAVPIPADQVDYLIATAARAPSVHNTQPWRFKVSRYTIELYADLRRKLHVDPLGREMLISCGAAVFGLRLGVRSLGYLPQVELLPDPARLRLRQPAYAAAGGRRDPVPDPGPPDPSRGPADAAATRPRPDHSSHRPPATRGPDRAVTGSGPWSPGRPANDPGVCH
ncbi:MAG: nitroreductase family protein [Streptosporangiaceae bacterium]